MTAPDAMAAPAPWYTQFWPWFIVSLLVISVVGSLFTVFIAVRGADTDVRGPFRVDAKAIDKVTDAEDLALSLGVGALLSLDASGRKLSLESWASTGEVPGTLIVQFAHPTLAADDRTVMFIRGADGVHRAEILEPFEGRREVVVSSANGADDAGHWEIDSQATLSPGAQVALGSARPGAG